jgi:hypothetical protein
MSEYGPVVGLWLAGKTEALEAKPAAVHFHLFVLHETYFKALGTEPGPCGQKPASSRLSYMTAVLYVLTRL